MSGSTVAPSDELYNTWSAWATENLGRDPALVSIAARAAVDAITRGEGFNAAGEAARRAWAAGAGAGRSPRSSRREWFGIFLLGCVVGALIAGALVALGLALLLRGGGGMTGL